MKLTALVLVLAGSVLAGKTAFAKRMNTDDLKWVNQCIVDNRGGASAEIIRKYCICMNEKMDDNETRSISVWEKTHARERAACDRESGWK